MSTFGDPTQYQINSITIDGQDVTGIFNALSLYEDIYRPCVTGNIVLIDGDGAGFIEENQIEFIEEIKFNFKNASGETLEFKGFCNSLRNEIAKGANKIYTIDFTSEAVRKNEQKFVMKAFRESSPEDIVQEMVKELGGKVESQGRGTNLTYVAGRKRPADVIKYVLTHGVTGESRAEDGSDENIEKEASGTTGFLCWETVDGFNFATVKDVQGGKIGTEHPEFIYGAANIGQSMEEVTKKIIDYEFNQIGDFQTKLRSGAFGSLNISFDMDTGMYKEYKYYNENEMTDKQKQYFPKGSISRVFNRSIDNQKFSNECQKAQPFSGDQSRKYLNQDAGMQNAFSDQTGRFTLPPQFKFRAGDTFKCRIGKVKGEKADGGPNKKHSGRYVIQSVGHHFYADGRGYTRIKTIRSTIQQDQTSSSSS